MARCGGSVGKSFGFSMLPIWYSPIYTDGLDPEARFPRDRYRLVREGLIQAERSRAVEFLEPEPLEPELLLPVHDRAYRDAFLSGTLDEEKKRRIGLRPWTEVIVERTMVLTNGTVSATRRVLEDGGIAANMGGGTHHAYRDFGSGYCIFNDLAVSAVVAQTDYGVERVLVLDLDVHQGDGTAAIFENDPSVETVSFHCGLNFPFRKMQSDHDEVFLEDTTDEEYLGRLSRFLDARLEKDAPGLILFQAGVDSLATDRLGRLSMTREGMKKRNELVFAFARALEVPMVITMGGGYGEPLETSVAAHVDLFHQASIFEENQT